MPSLLLRVCASSPRGVSVFACPGSAVIKVASWTIPFFTFRPKASSCRWSSVQIARSLLVFANRSLKFHTGVKSGMSSGNPRNFLNESLSAACFSNSDRIYSPCHCWSTSRLIISTSSMFGIPPRSLLLSYISPTIGRKKRFPIYHRFKLRQPIAKPFHSLVRLLQREIRKCFQNSLIIGFHRHRFFGV